MVGDARCGAVVVVLAAGIAGDLVLGETVDILTLIARGVGTDLLVFNSPGTHTATGSIIL